MSTTRALQNDLQHTTGVNVSDQAIRSIHEHVVMAIYPLVGRTSTGAMCFSQMRGSLSPFFKTDSAVRTTA